MSEVEIGGSKGNSGLACPRAYIVLVLNRFPNRTKTNRLYSRQSPNSFDTKRSTNSYQRFSHSDSALFFSAPSRVENWNEKKTGVIKIVCDAPLLPYLYAVSCHLSKRDKPGRFTRNEHLEKVV